MNNLPFILLYKSQQDAPVTEFILSDNSSTCFGRQYDPSLGAQNKSIIIIFQLRPAAFKAYCAI
jgi:hypothetical protein